MGYVSDRRVRQKFTWSSFDFVSRGSHGDRVTGGLYANKIHAKVAKVGLDVESAPLILMVKAWIKSNGLDHKVTGILRVLRPRLKSNLGISCMGVSNCTQWLDFYPKVRNPSLVPHAKYSERGNSPKVCTLGSNLQALKFTGSRHVGLNANE